MILTAICFFVLGLSIGAVCVYHFFYKPDMTDAMELVKKNRILAEGYKEAFEGVRDQIKTINLDAEREGL